MSPERTLESIIAAVVADADTLRARLTEAFEAGRAQGKREASNEVRTKLVGFFDSMEAPDSAPVMAQTESETNHLPVQPPLQTANGARATPGTVKPTIARLISTATGGLTTEDIVKQTGFKENSVRGTLHNLQNEGTINKSENRWFAGPPRKPEIIPGLVRRF